MYLMENKLNHLFSKYLSLADFINISTTENYLPAYIVLISEYLGIAYSFVCDS